MKMPKLENVKQSIVQSSIYQDDFDKMTYYNFYSSHEGTWAVLFLNERAGNDENYYVICGYYENVYDEDVFYDYNKAKKFFDKAVKEI